MELYITGMQWIQQATVITIYAQQGGMFQVMKTGLF